MPDAFPLPPALLAVLTALRAIGRPRVVGGGVRDWLLGLRPKDFDVEVPGTDFEQLHATLAPFGSTDVVGRSFGVIKLRVGENEYDFSLPRRESKTGSGHRGFRVAPDPALSDGDAAARRDFTLNAMGYDPFSQTLIDPLGGARDLEDRILRHASPAFVEDPLRVLRGFQLAARFDLRMAPETVELCRSISDSYRELPVERVWGEWAKWAEKSVRPSRGLQILKETGWLVHFPEVATLDGTPQDPQWHPEGDVFVHTGHCCDALARLPGWLQADAARRRVLMFAVLAHDFGKPSTTQWAERRGEYHWISPGHESAGGPLAEAFLRRIGSPLGLIDQVRPLVLHHLAHHSGQGPVSDPSLRRLARKLAPATIDDLCEVMRADHDGRPPMRSDEVIASIESLRTRARALELEQKAPTPLLLGRHLVSLGFAPGPAFSPVLKSAFEAQLDGEFSDEASGLEWLRGQLRQGRFQLRSA